MKALAIDFMSIPVMVGPRSTFVNALIFRCSILIS